MGRTRNQESRRPPVPGYQGPRKKTKRGQGTQKQPSIDNDQNNEEEDDVEDQDKMEDDDEDDEEDQQPKDAGPVSVIRTTTQNDRQDNVSVVTQNTSQHTQGEQRLLALEDHKKEQQGIGTISTYDSIKKNTRFFAGNTLFHNRKWFFNQAEDFKPGKPTYNLMMDNANVIEREKETDEFVAMLRREVIAGIGNKRSTVKDAIKNKYISKCPDSQKS